MEWLFKDIEGSNELCTLSIILRIFFSIIMGGILGAERGFRNRPAGFMTYVLVSVGATLFVLTNQFIHTVYPNTDATRFGAQVISGIGFLGAGSIIVTRHNEVRGLTTAAGLWVAAALGLAVGAGFYIGAIIGVIFSVFALLVLKKIDVYIKQHAKSMEIYMEYTEPFSLQTLHSYLKEQEFEIYEMKRGKAKTLEEEFGTLTFSIRLPKKLNHQEVLNSFYNIEGVDYIEEIA
ncbi:MAG: MgtC/SapB family protein [Christensenellaceae bacterium]|jgi:hypothetical protein|nr:MgtC/SapB family protein [Clostridia bacterium]PWL97369.1 MAG: magnesium transporter MgtC [Clostridiales bacterium]